MNVPCSEKDLIMVFINPIPSKRDVKKGMVNHGFYNCGHKNYVFQLIGTCYYIYFSIKSSYFDEN
jgi:hypothetical protein